jgi:AcrR family transcriptional regulator
MPRAGLTHDRVVTEAAAVADEIGLQQLTLAAVAARVGVAQPSLYKHVDGMDALRRGLAVLGLRELVRELSRAAAGKARGDALLDVASAYRSYGLRRPGPYEATLRAPVPDDTEHLAAASDVLGIVGAVLSGYGITGDDLTDAIRFLRAAMHGFVAIEAAGGMRMQRDNDVSFRRMVAGLDIAFGAWPSTTVAHTSDAAGRRRSR